jgi:hypothetical protein
MRWLVPFALVAVIAVTVAAERKAPPKARTDQVLRYPDVKLIFEQHCAKCHDVRIAKNPAAQAVFEMSNGYPFSTKRPATLVEGLKHMFEIRGSLSADEKALGLTWISGGALDADGKAPVWR